MSELKWRLIAMGAVLLACSVSYFVGKKQGHLDEKLSNNAHAIKENNSKSSIDSAKADTAKKNSEILVAYRSHVREKVVVQHDTVIVHSGVNSDTVVNNGIAKLITADDSTIAALKNFVEARAVVIADQRSAIALRDTRISLLESEGTPGKFKRFIVATKYIAIGAVVGVALSHR